MLIPCIIGQLNGTLRANDLEADIVGREKTPYSIWQKMQRNNLNFEQLCDIMAFRLIVPTQEDCYRGLGIVHGAYPVIPGRFKDYISTPKPNGYRSLHTGVFGPERQRIEIQIRTLEMHEIAEYGVAAHWHYKQGIAQPNGRQYRWLRELLEILEHAGGPEEFLEHQARDVPGRGILLHSKGRPDQFADWRHSVDFAYAVHSEIGDKCVGAKINGRLMPLRTVLQNGDQVEIITSRAQTPSPTWERFVVTGKARARIRRFIRSKEREQYLELGRSILDRAFSAEGYECSDKALEGVLKNFKQASIDDLCAQVGAGNFNARAVVEAVLPGIRKTQLRREGRAARPRPAQEATGEGSGYPNSRSNPWDGATLRRLLPPAPGRSDRRRRNDRQGGDNSHHRLRDAGRVRRNTRTLDRCFLGRWRW